MHDRGDAKSEAKTLSQPTQQPSENAFRELAKQCGIALLPDAINALYSFDRQGHPFIASLLTYTAFKRNNAENHQKNIALLKAMLQHPDILINTQNAHLFVRILFTGQLELIRHLQAHGISIQQEFDHLGFILHYIQVNKAAPLNLSAIKQAFEQLLLTPNSLKVGLALFGKRTALNYVMTMPDAWQDALFPSLIRLIKAEGLRQIKTWNICNEDDLQSFILKMLGYATEELAKNTMPNYDNCRKKIDSELYTPLADYLKALTTTAADAKEEPSQALLKASVAHNNEYALQLELNRPTFCELEAGSASVLKHAIFLGRLRAIYLLADQISYQQINDIFQFALNPQKYRDFNDQFGVVNTLLNAPQFFANLSLKQLHDAYLVAQSKQELDLAAVLLRKIKIKINELVEKDLADKTHSFPALSDVYLFRQHCHDRYLALLQKECDQETIQPRLIDWCYQAVLSHHLHAILQHNIPCSLLDLRRIAEFSMEMRGRHCANLERATHYRMLANEAYQVIKKLDPAEFHQHDQLNQIFNNISYLTQRNIYFFAALQLLIETQYEIETLHPSDQQGFDIFNLKHYLPTIFRQIEANEPNQIPRMIAEATMRYHRFKTLSFLTCQFELTLWEFFAEHRPAIVRPMLAGLLLATGKVIEQTNPSSAKQYYVKVIELAPELESSNDTHLIVLCAAMTALVKNSLLHFPSDIPNMISIITKFDAAMKLKRSYSKIENFCLSGEEKESLVSKQIPIVLETQLAILQLANSAESNKELKPLLSDLKNITDKLPNLVNHNSIHLDTLSSLMLVLNRVFITNPDFLARLTKDVFFQADIDKIIYLLIAFAEHFESQPLIPSQQSHFYDLLNSYLIVKFKLIETNPLAAYEHFFEDQMSFADCLAQPVLHDFLKNAVNAAIKAKAFDKAIDFLNVILNYPEKTITQQLLSFAHEKMGVCFYSKEARNTTHLEKAIRHFSMSTPTPVMLGHAWHALGKIRQDEKQSEAAEKCFTLAVNVFTLHAASLSTTDKIKLKQCKKWISEQAKMKAKPISSKQTAKSGADSKSNQPQQFKTETQELIETINAFLEQSKDSPHYLNRHAYFHQQVDLLLQRKLGESEFCLTLETFLVTLKTNSQQTADKKEDAPNTSRMLKRLKQAKKEQEKLKNSRCNVLEATATAIPATEQVAAPATETTRDAVVQAAKVVTEQAASEAKEQATRAAEQTTKEANEQTTKEKVEQSTKKVADSKRDATKKVLTKNAATSSDVISEDFLVQSGFTAGMMFSNSTWATPFDTDGIKNLPFKPWGPDF